MIEIRQESILLRRLRYNLVRSHQPNPQTVILSLALEVSDPVSPNFKNTPYLHQIIRYPSLTATSSLYM